MPCSGREGGRERALTPETFCRQGLDVLRLPAPDGDDARLHEPLEQLLRYFIAEPARAEVFELQLQLLADLPLCPELGAAARRLLACWRGERRARLARAGRADRN